MKIQFSPVKRIEEAMVFWHSHTDATDMVADWRFGQKLPFKDGLIKVAYLFKTFSKINEKKHEDFAKELFRVMAPNSELYIIENDFDYILRAIVGGDLKIEEFNKQFIDESYLNMDLVVSILKGVGFDEKKMAVWNEAQSFPKEHFELVLSAKK